MLERSTIAEMPERGTSDLQFIDLDRIGAILYRQWKVLAACAVVGLLLGVIYVITTPPGYLSLGQILIDENLKQLASDANSTTPQTDSALNLESDVLNQLEILKSSRLARAVAQSENLAADPLFMNPPPSLLDKVRDGAKNALMSALPFLKKGGNAAPAAAGDPLDSVVTTLMRNVTAERIGRSSVIEVGYQAATPELAQRIATAYAAAAVRDQLDADLDATKQAADWFQQRLGELGASQRQASEALEAFRQQSGQSVGEDRDLVTQRLNALTGQLVQAQAQTAQARALVDKVNAAIAAGPPQAGANASLISSAPGALDSNTSAILAHYAAVQSRIAELTAAFGASHPQVAVLERDRDATNQQIFAQLQKLADRYNADLAVAQGREAALRQDVENEGQSVAKTNQSQVKLDELQQRSNALSTLYNTFLSRYETAVQQQSFPIPPIRIVSEASMPLAPASPRTSLALAGALLAGLFVGAMLAAVNEIRERSFRVGSQVSDELGLRFLGYLPRLPQLRGQPATQFYQTVRNQVLNLRPNSLATTFTETLKASRVAMYGRRHAGRGLVVGVVSALPGEGKTAFSMGLAELLAASGSRVLLIDGDLRHPAASRFLTPDAKLGLVDVAEGHPWRSAIQIDENGLAVLASSPVRGDVRSMDVFTSAPIHALLQEARLEFDFIVIDLPPLGPVVDALSLLPLTDGFVFVSEWGRTPKRLIRSIFERDPRLAEAVIGVVLNKVDFKKLPRYGAAGSPERYLGVADRYYQNSPGTPRVTEIS